MKRLCTVLALAASLLLAQRASGGCVPHWTSPWSESWPLRTATGGHFNADSLTDIASVEGQTITLRLKTPTGFAAPTTLYEGTHLSTILIARDVTADGNLDLVAADLAMNLVITIPGNGNGTFAAAVVTGTGIPPSRTAIGDFTGDGKLDIALMSYSARTIAIRSGDDTGAFAQELARTALGEEAVLEATAAADLDGDTLADIVVTYVGSRRVDVFFGNGNGTFASPQQLLGGDYGKGIAIADLDADADLDVATADWSAPAMTILRNDGNRTFAQAVSYDAVAPSGPTGGISDIVVADVTQDDIPDIVLVQESSGRIVTFEGLGNGTFGEAVFAYFGANAPTDVSMFTGHFDVDGRIDLAVSRSPWSGISLFANNCGDIEMNLEGKYRVISVGGEAVFTGALIAPGGSGSIGYGPATGNVAFFEGGAELLSVPIAADGTFSARIGGLAEGTHTIRAEYAGDEHYRGASAPALTVKVTTVVTTLTIAASAAARYRYDDTITVTATITSSDGSQPAGPILLYRNEKPDRFGTFARPATWTVRLDGAGAYALQAEYAGSDTSPAALSEVLTIQVEKAPTKLVQLGPNWDASAQMSTYLLVRVEGTTSTAPSGVVHLYQGTTFIETETLKKTSAGGDTTFHPLLSPGKHTLRIDYPGDDFFLPSSLEFRHEILTSNRLWLHAGGYDTFRGPAIRLTWGGESFPVSLQRFHNGQWIELVKISNTSGAYEILDLQPRVPYFFRAVAFGFMNQEVGRSNIAMGMYIPFTDNPLRAGMPVKATHITELLEMTNAVRAASNLDPLMLEAGAGSPIRASDVMSIRAALSEALAVWGIAPVVPPHPALEPGGLIRAHALQQVRNTLR